MAKKLLCILLAVLMLVSITACSKPAEDVKDDGKDVVEDIKEDKKEDEKKDDEPADEPVEEPSLGYTFGVNEVFHSDEPVTYTTYFSDASWYPMVETWETEGVFKKIAELTNVTLDITSYDSSDYTNKITLEINSGESKYIIPKVYDESAFVDGGAVVAVSDYTQYMPNYTAFVEEFGLESDLATITRANGKYYRLPGMHEIPLVNYGFLIRQDLFEAAGIDVASQEADWTWDDLLEDLKTVKAYMVANGLCAEGDYIWSDTWSGSESGQNSGGNILKEIGATFGVKSGWAIANAMAYDEATDEWYCSSTSPEYKDFITFMAKLVNEKILDPETFTQDDNTANNKFFNGQTVIHAVNQSQYASYFTQMDAAIGAGNYELYLIVPPQGNNAYVTENTRLENGVMVSTNALNELGEEDFIKMMRFIDWLFYSDDAYTLTKWGIEGETYEVVDGIKQPMAGLCNSGLGFANDAESSLTDFRLQWGYACGNYFYGHRQALRDDNLSPALQDWLGRVSASRSVKPLDPVVVTDEDQNEMLNLWQTSIVDTINTWTLNFVTGAKNIDADWDAYVAEVDAAGLPNYLAMYNEAYQASK